MNTDFRSVDATYDQDYINGISDDEYTSLFAFLKDKNIKSVLDLAGGSGKLASMLLNHYDDVALFDIADNMIEQAIQDGFPKEKTICGDVFTHNFNRKYDAVILKSAMHEISRNKRDEFHSKVFDVLNNDGWFIDWDVHQSDGADALWLTEWVNLKDSIAGLDDLVRNRSFYTEAEIQSSLQKKGFANGSVFHRFFYTLSAKKFEDMYWKGDTVKTKKFIEETERLLKIKPNNIIVQEKSNTNIILKIPALILAAQKK